MLSIAKADASPSHMGTPAGGAQESTLTAENLHEQSLRLRCSIIVPVYNGARVITRLLDALAAQNVATAHFEIIIVDDGSTDGTPDVVRAWQRQHPAIHMRLATQANAGPASARNQGARLARAPLLFFTDADCIPQPGWVDAFLTAFAGDKLLAAAMGAYVCWQTEPAARFAQLEFEERYALMRKRQQMGESIDLIATYSAAYTRALFLEAGGFDVTFPAANNEDVEFSYRLSRAGHRMAFVPAAQVAHEHDSTWQGYFRTKLGRAFWRMVVYRRFPDKSVKDSYTPQVIKAQIPFALLWLLGAALLLCGRRARALLLLLPFELSVLPMLRFVMQREPASAWLVPIGSMVRALAFVAGVAKGALLGGKALRRAPVLHPARNEAQP